MSLSIKMNCLDSERSDINDNAVDKCIKVNNNSRIVSEMNDQPIFKILFRDKLTSSKYRERIENIIKYVFTSELYEKNEHESCSNSVINIFNENLETSFFLPEESNKEFNSKRGKSENDIKIKKRKMKNNNYQESEHQSLNNLSTDKTDENDLEADLQTCFQNNSIRIGSHEYYNQCSCTFITKRSFMFLAPTIKNNKDLKILNIELKKVLKVLVNFSKNKQAIFIHVSPNAAMEIRELIGMNDSNGPYLDPESTDLVHQYISILSTHITNESIATIRKLLKNIELIEIDTNFVDYLNDSTTTKMNDMLTYEKISYEKLIERKDKLLINSQKKTDQSKGIKILSSNIDSSTNLGLTLFCRIVKVGSYEYAKKRVFSLTTNGVKFCMPPVHNASKTVVLNIELKEILKILIRFSKNLPILFINISKKAARQIRLKLGMKDPNGPFIDPESTVNNTHHNITILPESIPEECKIITELIKQGKIKILDEQMTNEVLTKSFYERSPNNAVNLKSNRSAAYL